MSRLLKSTNRFAALLVALSMVAPPVAAATGVPRGAGSTALSTELIAPPSDPQITQVGDRRHDGARRIIRRSDAYDDRRERQRSYGRHDREDERRFYRDQRHRNGYRGYRDRREGYRRDNDGWWYPLAAFGIGALILNEVNNNRQAPAIVTAPAPRGGFNHIPRENLAAHDAWCNQKYRSYDWVSKTFQPYSGARKYCNSPYDLL